jgi:hypothetical protein
MLLGEVDEGKTTAGISVSEQFDPLFRGPVTIKDTLFITNERDPFEGPRQKGVDIPFWLDLTEHPGEKDFGAALNKAVSFAKEMASKGTIKNVVVDSLSSIDKTWKAHKSKAYEKWALIDALLAEHRRFLMEQLFSIQARIVLIAHIKKIGDALVEDKEKMASTGLDANDKFAMDISGWDAPKLYREQCSYIWPVRATFAKGKPTDYAIYPHGIGGIESKSKTTALSDKEPAHLYSIYQKIRTATTAA